MVKKKERNNENLLVYVSLGLLSLVAIVAIIYMSNGKDILLGNAVKISEGQTRCVSILLGLGGSRVEVYRGGRWVFQETCYKGCSGGKCITCTPKTEYKCDDTVTLQTITTERNCRAPASYSRCPFGCDLRTNRCAPSPPPPQCVDSDNGIYSDIPGKCAVSGTPLFDRCDGALKINEAYCISSTKCAYKNVICAGFKKCFPTSGGDYCK